MPQSAETNTGMLPSDNDKVVLVHEVSYVASKVVNLNVYLKQHDTDYFPMN